jgi:hypothetical protein
LVPKEKRPSFRGAAKEIEAVPVDRHSGVRTDPNARVSVYHDPLGKHVHPVTGKTQQEMGHSFERAIRDDVAGGSSYRERHTAGDKPRVGDVGQSEVKRVQRLTSENYDQLWRDLVAREKAHLIVEKLDPRDAKKLDLMAGIYEKKTGTRPTIAVRETEP